MMKGKKGEWEWEKLGKWILAIVLLLVILALVVIWTKGYETSLERIKDVFRFG